MSANWAAVFLESQTCQHHVGLNNFHSILVIFCKEAHHEKTSILLKPAFYHVTPYCTKYRRITPPHLSASSMRPCAGVDVAFAIFYYFLLKPVRSGKRWEVKSSSPFRGKINHFVEFSYSLLRHVGRTSIGNRLWCETTAGSFMALIWMQFIPADGVRWEGKVALPEWLVLATANFDASLCCWV